MEKKDKISLTPWAVSQILNPEKNAVYRSQWLSH